MKRFILWAIVLLTTSMVSSCELDDTSGRHRIFYKVETNLGHLNPIYTSLYFYEYDDYDFLVNKQVWEDVPDGEQKTFRAHAEATQLVVYIKIQFDEGTLQAYLSEVFQLTDKRTMITIEGETQITEYNPI